MILEIFSDPADVLIFFAHVKTNHQISNAFSEAKELVRIDHHVNKLWAIKLTVAHKNRNATYFADLLNNRFYRYSGESFITEGALNKKP